MSFWFSTDPWPLFVLAVSGVAMALPALLIASQKRTRPTWRAPVLLAILLGLIGFGAVAAQLPALVWLPAQVLGLVWLVFGLARLVYSKSTIPGLSRFCRPRFQATALCLSCGLLLAYQVHQLNREEVESLDAAEAQLSGIQAPPAFVLQENHTALTDAGKPIPLFRIHPDDLSYTSSSVEEARVSQRSLHCGLVQTGPASDDYNCHGWIFAGGRFWVRGNVVESILADNGYKAVPRPVAGDLAVFRDQRGEVSHTGLVHRVGDDEAVLVESKWGKLGRYVHTCADHIYGDNTCTFYRSSRSGHLLRGLESAQPGPGSLAAQVNEAPVVEVEGNLVSPAKEPKTSSQARACGKRYTQKQWRQWALCRQRQAEAASNRHHHPTLPNQFAWRNGATSKTPGHRSILPLPTNGPINRAANHKAGPRFFFPPAAPEPNRACGQWDYRKQS
jgi:hypothetical protein